jgi:hypothetical protein
MSKLVIKTLLVCFVFLSLGLDSARAFNVTWGKDKLLGVEVEYNGRTYRGHLIGVALEERDRQGTLELHIDKVGVLVYGLSLLGLDQVVPLSHELHSPLCKSFGYHYTNIWGGKQASSQALVARFVTPQNVTLNNQAQPWYTKSLTCSPHYADTSGD